MDKGLSSTEVRNNIALSTYIPVHAGIIIIYIYMHIHVVASVKNNFSESCVADTQKCTSMGSTNMGS